MARESEEYPEVGELVIGTVDNIFKQGAFIRLDEYGKKQGMLHLSEISPKWVRNIRDYVKEGQKVVLLVLKVNRERGHVDLSLRRVTDAQRKEKLQEVKQKQRAVKLFEILAKELKIAEKDLMPIKSAVIEKYDSLYGGLEAIATDNKEIDELDIPDEWKKPFLELINNSITSSLVSITGYLELRSYSEQGVEDIKTALGGLEAEGQENKIDIAYISAPLYRIKVTAKDYKSAEKTLRRSADEAIGFMEKHRGSGEFHRKLAEKPEK